MSELQVALDAVAHTTVAVGGTAGGSWALAKVLGPTLKAFGGAFGDFTDYRMRNLLKLEHKVARRLGDEPHEPTADDESVHPRVAREVLDEGTWIEDDLHQEYLAGLLVASRSKDGKDESNAYLARVVNGLTAEQIRLHYGLISGYAGSWSGNDAPLPIDFNRQDLYRRHAVRVRVDEVEEKFPHFGVTCHGLVREGIFQQIGRPLVGGGSDDTYTAGIPTTLAFDLYLEAFARPGTVGRQALLLPREVLAAVIAKNPGKGFRMDYPVPDDALLVSAHAHDLGP